MAYVISEVMFNITLMCDPKILCDEQKFLTTHHANFPFSDYRSYLHSNSMFVCLTLKGNLSRKQNCRLKHPVYYMFCTTI